jgi:hypothetical protein
MEVLSIKKARVILQKDISKTGGNEFFKKMIFLIEKWFF